MCNFYFRLCPYLYDLAHMNSENAKICIQEVIKEKYDKFEKNKTKYPGMDTVRQRSYKITDLIIGKI